MRRMMMFIGFIALFSIPAWAQEAPRFEVFGGYQYARVDTQGLLGGLNFHGWNAAAQVNLNDWFGVVADFSGGYRSSVTFQIPSPFDPEPFEVQLDPSVHSFLFGPQFSLRRERFTLFGRTLVGFVRTTVSAFGFSISDSAFGLAAGGGVDARVNDFVAVRIVQADYVLSRFQGLSGSAESQHNARVSAGVVFRFGRR